MKKEKKSWRTGTVAICAVLPATALLVVLAMILYPSVMAKREKAQLVKKLDRIAAAEDVSVLVSGMADYGYGTEADSGETYTSGSDAAVYVRALADAMRSARYLGRENAPGGSWDTRIRALGDGESVTVFRTSDQKIYFTRGITQFVFGISD